MLSAIASKSTQRLITTAALAAGLSMFLMASGEVMASPSLSLVKQGSAATADTITAGTATYRLDLGVNTDGNAVSGLQFYLQTTPANALSYSATPLSLSNSPFKYYDFGGGDIVTDAQTAIAAGATVNASAKEVLFKSSAGDYGAFSGKIGTMEFNTVSLPNGTYTFTPVGTELTKTGTTISTFATPGSFTLTVVPEPTSVGFLLLGAAAILTRWRRPSAC